MKIDMTKKEFLKWMEENLNEKSTFHVDKERGGYGNINVVIFPEEKSPAFLDAFFE